MPTLVPVTLTGRHVRLEPLSRAHVPALVAAATSGSRDTFSFTTVPRTDAEAVAYVDEALRQHAEGRVLPFATIDAASGQVVGSTRYLNVEFWPWPAGSPYQRGEHVPDVVEIGATWLAPAAQRTAINTEAKLLMLNTPVSEWDGLAAPREQAVLAVVSRGDPWFTVPGLRGDCGGALAGRPNARSIVLEDTRHHVLSFREVQVAVREFLGTHLGPAC